MISAPPLTEGESPRLCEQCGLPLVNSRHRAERPDRFCCYGCSLTHMITGTKGEEGVPIVFLARLGFAAFLAMNAMTFTWALYGDRLSFLFPVEPESRPGITYLIFLLSIPVYLLIGIPYLKNACAEFRNLTLGVDSLIAVGTTAAFVLSVYSTFAGGGAIYFDTATMVLVLVTFGRYLEANARLKTSVALRSLFSRMVPVARVMRGADELTLPPGQLCVGDLVRVLPGEDVPVDGIIVEGETSVNEALLTGESDPVRKRGGDPVIGGSTNYDGAILLRATRVGGETLLARLKKLTLEVQSGRSPLQLTADRLTRVFVPSVIFLAALSGVLWGAACGPAHGLLNGLSVLLIACPCALGIGATLASSIGYTTAARRGVLLGSIGGLEAAAGVTCVVFDKTGTLTEGKLTVHGFHLAEGAMPGRETILALAGSLEAHSEHPAGKAILEFARGAGVGLHEVAWSRTVPGVGIVGSVKRDEDRVFEIRIGRPIDPTNEINRTGAPDCYVTTYIALDGKLVGSFELADKVRASASPALAMLDFMQIETIIASGDDLAVVSALRDELGTSARLYGGMSPDAKIGLIRERVSQGGGIAMVGDGINDAPALAAATLGICLRSGTDLSKMTADVTIMDDNLEHIPWLFSFAQRVRRTIRWNFAWAFGYNIIGVGLALGGVLEPIVAAAAMVLSSSFVIVNSSRLTSGVEASRGRN